MAKQWGQPTWIFFHTFIEQIDDDFYSLKYNEILKIIKDICSVLPCPYCQEHAVQYMRKIRPQNVKTREQMRIMLYNFHNRVNIRLNKPLFSQHELTKYKKIDFIRVVRWFEAVMSKNYTLNRAFNEHMFRKRTIKNTVDFIRRNISHFSRK